MKSLAVALLGLGLLGASSAVAQDPAGKDNPTKIVGLWSAKKSENLPEGTTFNFTKEGKLTVRIKVDANVATLEGTYKVDAEKLVITFKTGDSEVKETAKILQLDDTTLKVEDKDMKVEELKKVSAK